MSSFIQRLCDRLFPSGPEPSPEPEKPKDYHWIGRPMDKLRRWQDTRSGKLWTLICVDPKYYPKARRELEDKDGLRYRPTDETFTIYFTSNNEECTEQCPKCENWLIPEVEIHSCFVCHFNGHPPDYELYLTKTTKEERGTGNA